MSGISIPLNNGTILSSGNNKYRIVSMLGQGGFGITYLAVAEIQYGNVTTEAQFAIKEHYPSVFCKRVQEDVIPESDKKQEYFRSKEDFISEAKKLHSLGTENENIVKVNEVFEANGTAYYIMQYINGNSLSDYVNKKKKLAYGDAIKLFTPIFDAVQFLHKSRINHLDIKPDNIMLHQGINGLTPVLIDFGQSVHFKKNGDKTSPKGVMGVSEGYSPLEQYAGITEFSPVTDIYALAATLLFTLTGETPDSASKIKLSNVRNELAGKVPEAYIEGICKALNKSDDDRTTSIAAFKSNLGVNGSNEGKVTEVIGIGVYDPWYKKYGKYIASIFLIAVIVFCCIALPKSCNKDDKTSESQTQQVDSESMMQDSITISSNQSSNISDDAEQTESNEPAVAVASASDKRAENHNSSISQGPAHKLDSKPEIVRTGTLSLGYGTWTGGIKNGKMDGKGAIVFTSPHRIPGSSHFANPGERLEATFTNGQIERGKLYDSDGNLLKSIF